MDRAVASAAIALWLIAAPSWAGTPCTGALKKTCLTPLLRCYKPKGACHGTFTIANGGVRTLDCWANKVTFEIDAAMDGTGTITYRRPNGKTCLRGTIVFANHIGTFTFKRGKKTWIATKAADDSLTVACPNHKTEQYAGADVDAQPASCAGFGDTACTAGTCPYQ